MIDRIMKTDKCCEMEMNVFKTKIMRISRELSPVQNMKDQKELENVEYLKYFL